MLHTYQDPKAPGDRALGFILAGFVLFLPVVIVLNEIGHHFTWGGFVRAPAEAMALVLPFACLAFWWQHGICSEIRLDDNGTCELETRGQVIRLRVDEIRSVKGRRDADSERESYTIHHEASNRKHGIEILGPPPFAT